MGLGAREWSWRCRRNGVPAYEQTDVGARAWISAGTATTRVHDKETHSPTSSRDGAAAASDDDGAVP